VGDLGRMWRHRELPAAGQVELLVTRGGGKVLISGVAACSWLQTALSRTLGRQLKRVAINSLSKPPAAAGRGCRQRRAGDLLVTGDAPGLGRRWRRCEVLISGAAVIS
jgi:hypothetical protein